MRWAGEALLCIAIGVACGGCTIARITAGYPLTGDANTSLREGMPKTAVLERLGPPNLVGRDSSGSTFEYQYRKSGEETLELAFIQASFNYEATWERADRLVVRFDREGRLVEHSIVRQTERPTP